MKLRILFQIFITGLLYLLIFTGCSEKSSRFSVGFRNMCKDNISIIDQRIGSQGVVAGTLVYKKVKSSTILIEGFNFPETVLVKWEKGDKRIIEKTVILKNKIPKEFQQDKDEILFNIFDNDTVELSFKIKSTEGQIKEINSDGNIVNW